MRKKLAARNKAKLSNLYQKAVISGFSLMEMVAIVRASGRSTMTDRHIRRFGCKPDPDHPGRKQLPWGVAIPVVSGKGKVVGFVINQVA